MIRHAGAPLLLALVLCGAGCTTVPRQPADPLAAVRVELREAARKDSATSIGLYLDAARKSLALATSDTASSGTRASATALYDRAVAECVVALRSQNIPNHAAHYDITFAPPRGVTRFLVADTIPRKHLKADIRRPGFGGALVGVMDGPDTAGPNRPPKGFAGPWTAVAEFGPATGGRTPVTIRVLDPRAEDHVRLAGARRPLAGDFTAPLAYYPHPNELLFGVIAMLRSDRSATHSDLLFYEPYDPKKIPVLFVHGLMSSPHAWLQVVNELNADPDFRRRYQVWSYFYPTGAPIAGNALTMRDSLAAAAARYSLRRNLVIVGHSMGGILTRMQVTNSGRALWNAIFRGKADKIYAEVPADSILKRALIFRANPHVARVIFIATPHRGSDLANLRISALAARFIRMPVTLVKGFKNQIAGVLQQVDPSIRTVPTSIQGLSPRSPLLRALAGLPLAVPCDTIIGNRGLDKIPIVDSSDGIVPYWSSHLPMAGSEIIVPTGHDAFNNPAAVADLRRILAP